MKTINIKITKKEKNIYNLRAWYKDGKSDYFNINKKELIDSLKDEVEKL